MSLSLYADHADNPAVVQLASILSVVGIVLCLFLIFMLHELGRHIRHYWAVSNRIVAPNGSLRALVFGSPPKDAPVTFPPFCRRLQYLAGLFLAGHLAWLAIVLGWLA